MLTRFNVNFFTLLGLKSGNLILTGSLIALVFIGGELTRGKSPYWKVAIALTAIAATIPSFLIDKAIAELDEEQQEIEKSSKKGRAKAYDRYYSEDREDSREIEVIEEQPLTFFDWESVKHSAVGFIISGQSGSGKTSVACWLGCLLTQDKPSQVLALDPHWNDSWEIVGIKSIGNIDQIESILGWLIEELDRRCDRKGNKQPLGDNLIIFLDEVNACLERFSNPKKVQSAIKRLGSEGRKMDMTAIILNQSPNAEDIGVSKKYLNNYLMVALCSGAREIADNKFKQTDRRYQEIYSIPYPCVVSGSVPLQLAKHPTHGDYSVYVAKGNPPRNLTKINQLPLTIPIGKQPLSVVTEDNIEIPVNPRQLLEKCLNLSMEDEILKPSICPQCGGNKFAIHARTPKLRYRCSNCKNTKF